MTAEIKQCWSINGEDFLFQSLHDLLESGADLQPGDIVHVGEADHPETRQLINAEDVMEQMTDRAWDIAGEYAMDYPDVSKEAKAELEQLLEAWITKHCPPDFFVVKNSKEYTLTVADMEAFSSRIVIETLQRLYEHEVTPEKVAEENTAIASVKGGAA